MRNYVEVYINSNSRTVLLSRHYLYLNTKSVKKVFGSKVFKG